jgi:DNA-binding CsgD family transcriptional regulator
MSDGFSKVENLIATIGDAATSDDVFAAVQKHVELLGFEYFLYDLVIPPTGLRPTYYTNYPKEYVKQYIAKRYARYDTIINHAATTIRPFEWNDVVRMNQLTANQKLLRHDAWDSGLKGGAMVPIHGPGTTKAYFTVSNNMEPIEFKKMFIERRHELHVLATYTHERILDLCSKAEPTSRVRLTPRESEVMVMVALGKSNWDISKVCGISENTVKDYLKRIFRKMNVNSKAHATAVAISNGFIQL